MEHMPERELPGAVYGSETQNKILDAATELFALKGFSAVSMRDISRAVGIKTASIYYYYEGKESILADVLSRFEKGYRHYFDWLTDINKNADSLESVMENMFNREFLEMRDPMGCLGMAVAVKEQHNNESARKCVFELFYDFSVTRMREDFDRLAEKGVIAPSDTKTLATLFMFGVIAYNDLRVHEYAGVKQPLDSAEIYGGMKKLIMLSLVSPN